MILNDDFYHIVATETTENDYRCKVKLNAGHRLYSVHFPGNPVTPGVCLVQMAIEILEQSYGKKFLLSSAGSIKFKKTVGPDGEPWFIFTKMVFADGQLKVNVSVEDDDNQFVKMSLMLLEKES